MITQQNTEGFLQKLHLQDGVTGLWRSLSRIILPPTCGCCFRLIELGPGLCSDCWQQLVFISSPVCERLGIPLAPGAKAGMVSAGALSDPPPWHRARAALKHEGPAQRMVSLLKYSDRTELVQMMANWMAVSGKELLKDGDLIVPMPLHWRKLWRRRFNQSYLLAKCLSQKTSIDLEGNALMRHRATRPQVGLSLSARKSNVVNAFSVKPESAHLIRNRRIVLVDDVLTTGATAAAATRVLLRAGAHSVDILSFTRAYHDA